MKTIEECKQSLITRLQNIDKHDSADIKAGAERRNAMQFFLQEMTLLKIPIAQSRRLLDEVVQGYSSGRSSERADNHESNAG